MIASVDRATPDDLDLSTRQQNLVLAALLVFALALRIVSFLYLPGPHFPDEVYQSFEQAHRWAFGSGVLPWEFRTGIRSPVLPGLLSGLFAIVEPWVGGPIGYLVVARTFLAGLSLVAVAAVYRMGLRESIMHGVIAGFVAATWFEIVYFAGRPLTEAIATTFLVVGLALATPTQAFSIQRLVAIGACFGFCVMLRIQLAPALLVGAIIIARTDLRSWPWLAVGGCLPIAIFGLADWYWWGSPFASYWRSIVANVIEGRASQYGTSPFSAYLSIILGVIWTGVGAILLVLCMLRWRASMLWIAVALAIIVTHSLIPHKEYRFVFPATVCLAIVAALSSADLLRAALRKNMLPFDAFAATRLACLIWLVTSASLFVSPSFREPRTDRAPFDAQFEIAKVPELCGLLVHLHHWTEFGGQAYMHRAVPLYFIPISSQVADTTPAYNVILTRRYAVSQMPKDYTLQRCFDSDQGEASNACILKRAGTCTPNPALELNQHLIKTTE
ncbi:alg9-like mannosyltransferase family protein [Variibacter gotjawalensis]|uniref:Alg9-like mannosyltransferase family protein n=1 Tax=Variibacter gotjawalensis TaxID=1333996 RepID=A0A0S3Q0W6_9BRAD|nr:Alg9-like mannosyltransferase family protein [Variibacter gotjawalensis]BAT61779.1 alg9-like mannosyltransferase family protein [Variibacter gotjawalensis]